MYNSYNTSSHLDLKSAKIILGHQKFKILNCLLFLYCDSIIRLFLIALFVVITLPTNAVAIVVVLLQCYFFIYFSPSPSRARKCDDFYHSDSWKKDIYYL